MKLFYSTVFTLLITSLSSLNSKAQIYGSNQAEPQVVASANAGQTSVSQPVPQTTCSNTEHSGPYPMWMANNETMAGNVKAFQ